MPIWAQLASLTDSCDSPDTEFIERMKRYDSGGGASARASKTRGKSGNRRFRQGQAAFLRWVGGKRWLVPHLRRLFGPARFKRFIDPFAGSGATFLEWGYACSESAILSDKNSHLIDALAAVRRSPGQVIQHLEKWKPTKTKYLDLRAVIPNGHRYFNAARFIFLNRLAWNGLYRVNKRGEFNVPFTPKGVPDRLSSWIRAASERLSVRGVSLKVGDYSGVVRRFKRGDLLFLDPPYVDRSEGVPPHRYYNEDEFTWENQRELAAFAKRAAKQGATVVVTPGKDARVLYPKRHFERRYLLRNQQVANETDFRRRIREYVIVSRDSKNVG